MSRFINLPRLFRGTGADRRDWYHIDAGGLTVGRVAQTISVLLSGKHKPIWSPDTDVGDYVVVTNADKVEFTGHKWRQKIYHRHSTYPGSLKEIPAWRMLEKEPTRILRLAVKGMLPRNRTRKDRFRRLKLLIGPENPFEGQLHPNAHLADPVAGEAQEMIAAPSARKEEWPIRSMKDFSVPEIVQTEKGIIIPHNPQILPPGACQKRMHHVHRIRKPHLYGEVTISPPEDDDEPFHLEIKRLAEKKSTKMRKQTPRRNLDDFYDTVLEEIAASDVVEPATVDLSGYLTKLPRIPDIVVEDDAAEQEEEE